VTTFFGDADIERMLGTFGVPVDLITNSVLYQTKGVVDTTDEDRLTASGQTFVGHFKAVVVKTGTLVGLAEGVTLNIEGVPHRVMSQRQEDDGALTRVYCARVA
jgi:hypothetical protein